LTIIFIGYVFVESIRLNQSSAWLSEIVLGEATLKQMSQFGAWAEGLELLFGIVFILMVVFMRKKLKQVIVATCAYFLLIVASSFLINQFIPLPIRNVLQIIVLPILVLLILPVYFVWRHYRMKLRARRMFEGISNT